MKPNIEDLPCFNQVAAVIGRAQARIELFKAVGWKKWFNINQDSEANITESRVSYAFIWAYTPQDVDFWNCINCDINPYTGEKVND